jgi:hypothetical protein
MQLERISYKVGLWAEENRRSYSTDGLLAQYRFHLSLSLIFSLPFWYQRRRGKAGGGELRRAVRAPIARRLDPSAIHCSGDPSKSPKLSKLVNCVCVCLI